MSDDDDSDGIQFTLTGNDHRRLKTWTNIVVTTAALVIAVSGVIKPQPPQPAPDPVRQSSYDELKAAIERVEKDTGRNHDDVAAIRAFLEGYLRARQQEPGKAGGKPAEAVPSLPSIGPRPEAKKIPDFKDLK